MKTIFLTIGLVISLIIQIFFLQTWQSSVIVPNILLAFIVMVGLYSNTEQLLWMSLFAGLFSDIYSSSEFGFYLGFYLLLAIISKYLLKFGEVEYSWWRPLVFLAMASAVQALVIDAGLYSSLSFWTVTTMILSYVTFTVIAGAIWYLIMSQADELIKRLVVIKANK